MAVKGFSSVEGDGTTQEMGLIPSTNTPTHTIPVQLETADIDEDDNDSSSNKENEVIILSVENVGPSQKDKNPSKKQKKVDSTSTAKTLQEMHEETLSELRNINNHIKIVANSLVNVTDILRKVYSCNDDE